VFALSGDMESDVSTFSVSAGVEISLSTETLLVEESFSNAEGSESTLCVVISSSSDVIVFSVFEIVSGISVIISIGLTDSEVGSETLLDSVLGGEVWVVVEVEMF